MPLAFGSALHAALAAFYGLIKATGAFPELERLHQVFAEAWGCQVNGKVRLQDDEDDVVAEQIDKGIAMLSVFHQAAASGPLPVVDLVEHRFSVDVFHPDSGEVLEEKLSGVVDLVLAEDGHRVICEHKSSARKYTQDQLAHDFQPTAYQFAAEQLGWGDPIGLRLSGAHEDEDARPCRSRTSSGTSRPSTTSCRTAVGVLKAIDAGAFFPVRGWQCKSCPYSHACGRRS